MLNFSNFSESLILAQSERWRRGLGMQVERYPFLEFADRKESGRGKRNIAADW